jgi:predicted unusual protein kinase regulating ubiquinone biosynthesis (AarF/ABC1/UbiB family)
MANKKKGLITSAASRFTRLGGLAGRVGATMAAAALRDAVFKEEGSDLYRTTAVRQAEIIAETLGQMKGAPMKVGQMMSLHEGLLPEEVADVLRSLQKDAPPAPFEDIEGVLKRELSKKFRQVRHVEPHAHAAASIGQVHRARLKDDRQVVFKVQYPGIASVIRADMKNLKGVLTLLFGMITRMDMEPVWRELNARLLEEVDYRSEARHMERMRRLWADDPDIIIPEVVAELSTGQVLCMVYEKGLSPSWACSDDCEASLRDRWGGILLKLVVRGLFEHRCLHADPNMANFSFCRDGRVVVYDFGCVKEVPAFLSRGYADLTLAVLEDRLEAVPGLLQQMGVHMADGSTIPQEMVTDFAEVAAAPFREGGVYTFGETTSIYDEARGLARRYRAQSMEVVFPGDLIFVDRSIGGHFGNLARLKATGDWQEILLRYIDAAREQDRDLQMLSES